MGRTNFRKAEDSFAETMNRFAKEQLLAEADQAKGVAAKEPQGIERKRLLKILLVKMKRVAQTQPELYNSLGVTRKELQGWAIDPSKMSEEEWKKLEKAYEILTKTAEEKVPESVNDTLVQEERHKHINKRFNVNDRWLPLR